MYEQKNINQLLQELDCEAQKGLSKDQAQKRLDEHGLNQLVQSKPKTIIEMFLEQLNSPLIFILFVAAALSMLLHEMGDTVIIISVILLNSAVGVIQEGRAAKALDALKKLTSPHAVVKRDGTYYEIEAGELVPGDLVLLEAGRQVPADIRLVDSSSLKIEESALTGESLAVEKSAKFIAKGTIPIGDRKNMAYMSTNVIYGRGEGIVIATGMNTEIGKIAGMIDKAPQMQTPLQKRLNDLGKFLSIISVVLCVALFGIAVIQRRDIIEMLLTAISLAVAAVPEGLPAVVTIVLALSVSRMVRVNTIVRKLPSVETLGAVSIVCSDKTGTLTQNKMTITECYFNQESIGVERLNESKHNVLIEGFTLCNDAVISDENRLGDPTELALLDMANRLSLSRTAFECTMPRVGEIPFDSKRKLMTTYHQSRNRSVSYTKGSCDAILAKCNYIYINGKQVPITTRHKKDIEKAMESMAKKALRVLGLAMSPDAKQPVENNLTFIGMVGMMDPARPEVEEAINLFKHASVKTVMITGDHVETALAIANQLGIASRSSECMSGDELSRLSDQELQNRIGDISVFARVSPEHKVRIVEGFQKRGRIVAMTGDGVNDAPALKTADIGIAMGQNGTDVAKNASDIILTDDNFATIEKAIEEGRGVYENIKKSVLFLLSSNFGEIITMFLSILVGLASPLKSSHILWVNLITDSLPALALGVDRNDTKLLMKKPPRNPKESLFAHGGYFCTIFYGALIGCISLVAFLTIPYGFLKMSGMTFNVENVMMVIKDPGILARCQTYAFTVLGISELFHAIGMRNVEQSIFKMDHKSNKLMIVALFMGLFLQVIVTEIPYLVQLFGTARLSINEWIRLIFLSATPLLAHELLLLRAPAKKKKAKVEQPVGNM